MVRISLVAVPCILFWGLFLASLLGVLSPGQQQQLNPRQMTLLRSAPSDVNTSQAVSMAAQTLPDRNISSVRASPNRSSPALVPGWQKLPETHPSKALLGAVCKKLLAAPLHTLFFSQNYQDWYLYNDAFKNQDSLGESFQPFYVDVGANDPIIYSNTLFFDACLGWPGICVEPNPIYHAPLRRLRSCTVVPYCVSKEETNVTMQVGSGYFWGTRGHIVTHPHSTKLQANPKLYSPLNWNLIHVHCLPLDHIITEFAPKEVNTPRNVAFLDVDVEAHEVSVFNSFPFQRFNINAIVVEVTHANGRYIGKLLRNMGFVWRPSFLLGDDAIFRHYQNDSHTPPPLPLIPVSTRLRNKHQIMFRRYRGCLQYGGEGSEARCEAEFFHKLLAFLDANF